MAVKSKKFSPERLKKFKKIVWTEHQEIMGWPEHPAEVTVKKAPGEHAHFFAYWVDGQIERRDTYFILTGHAGERRLRATLAFTEKRYGYGERWIEEQ